MSDETDFSNEEQVVAAFRKLADEVEHRSNPEDIPYRFEEALNLMLQARGMEPVEIEGEPDEQEVFPSFATRFRGLLMLEAYEQAAFMLLPTTERTGPGYFGGFQGRYYSTHIDTNGYDEGKYMSGSGCVIEHPISSGGGPLVKAYHPVTGMAMLAATLKAHAEWTELWQITSAQRASMGGEEEE